MASSSARSADSPPTFSRATPGYKSFSAWLPEHAASIVILANNENVDMENLLRQLLPAALQLPRHQLRLRLFSKADASSCSVAGDAGRLSAPRPSTPARAQARWPCMLADGTATAGLRPAGAPDVHLTTGCMQEHSGIPGRKAGEFAWHNRPARGTTHGRERVPPCAAIVGSIPPRMPRRKGQPQECAPSSIPASCRICHTVEAAT